LIAAFPKMLFPFLVILPGLIAIALPTQNLASLAGTHSGATIEGKGLIRPKWMPAQASPWSTKNGVVELDYDLAVRTCCCTTSPPESWAWA